MEKFYKVLKALIVLLAVAVVLAAAWRIGMPAEENLPQQTQEDNASAAPDFTVYDLDGNSVKLSDFRGKPMILNFWASWCGPCKVEMPDLEEAYLAYGSEIAFMTINLTDGRNETVESASSYIAGQGYTFPVYYDTNMEATYAYGINSIPMTYFIDAEGNVISSNLGMISASKLQQGIDALLSSQ